jgi:hypothetical protein
MPTHLSDLNFYDLKLTHGGPLPLKGLKLLETIFKTFGKILTPLMIYNFFDPLLITTMQPLLEQKKFITLLSLLLILTILKISGTP